MKWLGLILVLALAACSKKHAPPGPPPRCVVKLSLPTPVIDGTKAPTCSVTVSAPDTTSYADVIAAMDAAAKAGFVDFGVGDVTSKLPAPASPMVASRTTNEGLMIGRLDGMADAPMIVIAANGDVMVAGGNVGNARDPKLTDEISAALAKPGAGSAAAPIVLISADAHVTYGTIYRAAKAADQVGYAGILFATKGS